MCSKLPFSTFCLRDSQISVAENRPRIEHINTKYGTKVLEEGVSPRKSWSQACWKPGGAEDVQFRYSETLLYWDTCPYDPDTFTFCRFGMIGDFGWGSDWDIFQGIGGNATERQKFNLIKSPEGPTLNASESKWRAVNQKLHKDGDNGSVIGQDSSAGYHQLHYKLGAEKFTANLTGALTNVTHENSWSNTTGCTISMLPQAEVRWYWLSLLALLNVATVVLLAATAWTTRNHNMSLWKTSLIAPFFHGLETDLQGATSDTRVSRIEWEAEKMHARLKKSRVPGKMVFGKDNEGKKHLSRLRYGLY